MFVVGLFALYEVAQVLVVLKRSNVIGVIEFNNNSQAVKDQQCGITLWMGHRFLKRALL